MTRVLRKAFPEMEFEEHIFSRLDIALRALQRLLQEYKSQQRGPTVVVPFLWPVTR
jgi:hypothetical protein